MKQRNVGILVLFITSIIWGMAFVAQSAAMDYIGPVSYNGVRMLLGALVLAPIIRVLDHRAQPFFSEEDWKTRRKNSWKAGCIAGVFLFLATTAQQIGMVTTSAGKASFITAIYIVMVPLFSLLIGKKVAPTVWIGLAVAMVGFYFLCVKDGFTLEAGDLWVLSCALIFPLQILTIDRFGGGGKNVDPLRISQTQFLVTGLISLPLMFLFEDPSMAQIWDARYTILYTGVLSCGVAYSLQIVGQMRCEPTLAALIMSMEAVFGALFGALILHERLSPVELLGCALVFSAVLIVQFADRIGGRRKGVRPEGEEGKD